MSLSATADQDTQDRLLHWQLAEAEREQEKAQGRAEDCPSKYEKNLPHRSY